MGKTTSDRKTFMADFLCDLKFSRRSFMKASAASGAAVAMGAGLKPKLHAFAEAAEKTNIGSGRWLPTISIAFATTFSR